MNPGGARESLRVGGMGSKDVVSVLSKANHRGVDRVCGPGPGSGKVENGGCGLQ
jgi:hypothetical protein